MTSDPTPEQLDPAGGAPNEDQIWAEYLAEERAEQAKRWAIVAVIVSQDGDGLVLNYGGFEPYDLEGVGTWCSDEGLDVPKLDKGIYYVSNIGVRADEEDFEAWGEWALIAPITRESAMQSLANPDGQTPETRV